MERQHYNIGKLTNSEESTSSGKEDSASNDIAVKTAKDAFRVDTGLIPQGALDEQGSSELQELGLTVFNQDVFEQGVMDQVDHALAREEEIRLKNVLMRELTAINDDILLAKKDLERANEAEANIEEVSDRNRDIQRHLESIRKQKENKVKQLRTLNVRRENVKKKLAWFDRSKLETTEDDEEAGASTVDEAFSVGVKPKKETERERMIRTGEMTPFGTLVKNNAQQSSSKQIQLSHFEKQLVAKVSTQKKVQKDFSKYLKQKAATASKVKNAKFEESHEMNSSTPSVKARKTDRFDEKEKSISNKEEGYSLPRRKRSTGVQSQPEHKEDGQISDEEYFERDEEEIEDDEDEYQPSKDELQEEFSDDEEYADNSDKDDNTCERKKSTRSRGSLKRKKPKPLPKYRGNSDEDEPLRTKVKRDKSIRQEKDDADAESYQKRLFKQQKLDQLEEGQDTDSDDDPEAEFDGGFQVPRKLWKKLFKYGGILNVMSV